MAFRFNHYAAKTFRVSSSSHYLDSAVINLVMVVMLCGFGYWLHNLDFGALLFYVAGFFVSISLLLNIAALIIWLIKKEAKLD